MCWLEKENTILDANPITISCQATAAQIHFSQSLANRVKGDQSSLTQTFSVFSHVLLVLTLIRITIYTPECPLLEGLPCEHYLEQCWLDYSRSFGICKS